jgi:hypothetical protein
MMRAKTSSSSGERCDNLVRLITLVAIVWCLILVANSAISRVGEGKTFHGVESIKYNSLLNKADSFVKKFESEIAHSSLISSSIADSGTQNTVDNKNNLRSEDSSIHPEKPNEKDVTRVEDPEIVKEDQEEKKAEEILMKNAEQRKKGLFPKGAARDAVFALAIDTDPKNLVRISLM